MSDYCKPLSDDIISAGGSTSSDKSDLKGLLESKLPHSDKKEVDGEFKKVLVLAAQKSKQKRQKPVRKSKQYLTAKERRTLGLYRLPKRGLKYSSFLPLNSLWNGYMAELLDFDTLEK